MRAFTFLMYALNSSSLVPFTAAPACAGLACAPARAPARPGRPTRAIPSRRVAPRVAPNLTVRAVARVCGAARMSRD